MATITDWVAMGKPTVKKWTTGGYVYVLPQSRDKTPWVCSTLAERTAAPGDREEWYRVKPGCAGAAAPTEGLQYSPTAGGYLGSGVKDPGDAYVPKYTPPPPSPAQVQPEAPANRDKIIEFFPPEIQPAQPTGDSAMRNMFSTTGIAGTMGTILGGPLGGVGGSALGSVLSGTGKSRCPGPYNYDPVTGACVPKPDIGSRLQAGGSCPSGYHWDGTQCVASGIGGTVQRILPGGQTGTGVDVYGNAVMGAFGMPALVPATESQPTRRCPPGLVLGKDNLCYARSSIRNSDRKWPKPPRPLLSAQDMKTIRKAASLQNKVKRTATKSGFTCRKK